MTKEQFNEFIEFAEKQYMVPGVGHREERGPNVFHSVDCADIQIEAILNKPTNKYMMTISKNSRFKFLPPYETLYDEPAEKVFKSLESKSEQKILDKDKKDKIISAISRMKSKPQYKEIMGNGGVQIKEDDVIIQSFREYLACAQKDYFYTIIKSKGNKDIPEYYNSNNSNDYAFAEQLFNLLKERSDDK